MISNYIDSFVIGVDNNPLDLTDIISDETEKIKSYIRGGFNRPYPVAESLHIAPKRMYEGVKVQLKEEYVTYHTTLLETYGSESHSSRYTVKGNTGESFVYASDDVPYENFDSWIVIISSVPYSDFESNTSLVDIEFLVAYGVNLQVRRSEIPPPEPTDTTGAVKLNYVEQLSIQENQIDITDRMTNETQSFLDFISGVKVPDVSMYAKGTFYSLTEFRGLVFTLKEEYREFHIGFIHMEGNETQLSRFDWEVIYDIDEFDSDRILRSYDVESFLFVVSNIPLSQLENDPTLAETQFVHAYGITFKKGEEPEPEDETDLPPEPINPADYEGQVIEVLDGTTLEHYSYVPDIYNVKITQSINGLYTLDFNLQPYVNASNIYTPRIVFCDNDYFHVQQITKRHHLENLEMDVHCEHVSYELNYPPQAFWDGIKEDYVWTEDTYRGTASEILWELLAYNNRFSVGTVDNNTTTHTFKTSTEGFRSRINEFAEQIGLEVRWNKFTVSLLRKRGRDHGLTFEVGKNIVGLTEIIDTMKLGKVERSYELDVLDLNYVYDSNDAPLELHNITLGDAVTIVNPNYRIQRKDRIVSITRDPFQKALPTIEFGNKVASYTSDNKGAAVGTAIDLPIYQENVIRWAKGNAFGYQTYAQSDYGFATGYLSSASGNMSFATGNNTSAEGVASHSTGYVTRARGQYSSAEGYYTYANGIASHGEGYSTYANGNYSHSEGYETKANGHYSHSEGYFSQSTADMAHSEGNQTVASGDSSHSEGYQTVASGSQSHSEGAITIASGSNAHAEGFSTVASGWFSHASGHTTVANVDYSFAIGMHNKEFVKGYNWTQNDIFIIGNGDNGKGRSNAFRVHYNGTVYAQGGYNSTGADYSEFFEWVDGNPNADDRKGYVVTLKGDKIRLANDSDNYILGIVSVNPSIVGNSYEDQWHGRYITDDWGNVVYHYTDYPFEELDDEGNLITVYRESYVPMLNPNYNKDEPYTPRSQRPEWSTIGMLGKLLVRDDGTCKINKYAKLSKTVDGILSHSDDRTQFFVLQRINENLVEVLLK